MSNKKCGFIALVGRPNAGKSTLLNALVGTKLAVVSRKPQTTRNRILGAVTEGDAQLVFLDTPGIHRLRDGGGHRLNRAMNRVALSTSGEADLVCYLVDATSGWNHEDQEYFAAVLASSQAPLIVLATKADAMHKSQVRVAVAAITEAVDHFFDEPKYADQRSRWLHAQVFPCSGKRPESVLDLKELLAKLAPEGEWMFAEDDLTNLPNRFFCAELIREQVFRQLGQEIPYGCAVRIEEMTEKPNITVIMATILVERDSHKGIVVGKGGARIKEIGMAARTSLERHLDGRVFLDLGVRVLSGWTDDDRLIAELAQLEPLADDVVEPDYFLPEDQDVRGRSPRLKGVDETPSAPSSTSEETTHAP